MKPAGQLAAIIWMLAGGQAVCGENPRLLVLDVSSGENGPGEAEARAVSARLWEALGERTDLECWTAEVLSRELSRQRPEGLAGVMERALSLMAQGREALGKGKADRAADDFQSALVLLRQQQAFLDDGGPLISAWLGLGEALLSQKRLPEAKEAFAQALSLSPGYEPDPEELGEKARKVFFAVRESAADLPGGWLKLSSAPPGAQVEVDGFRAGETPLRREFAAGLHAVRVTAPDYRESRQVIEIDAGAETELDVKLEPLPVGAMLEALARALAESPDDPRPAAAKLLQHCDRVLAGRLLALPSGEWRLVLALISASGTERRVFSWTADGAAATEVAGRIAEMVAGSPLPPQDEKGLDFSKSYLGRVPAPAAVAAHRVHCAAA
jgi:tetratricopeptide (TPR) repeat protein